MIGSALRLLLASVLLVWSAPASAGPPPASALNPYPADRLLPFWRQYTARYEESEALFIPAYRLDPPPAEAADMTGFWLEAADARLLAVGVDADGYLVLPAEAHNAGFVTRSTRLLHDGGGLLPAIRLELHVRAEPAARYAIADLATVTRELDQFQRASMGLAALMAPRFDVIVFRFDGPAPDGWHVTARGERSALSALHDTLYLRMTGRIARAGGEIVLEETPRRIVVETR
ncbi:hypothetical protein X907_2696 [Glycocaulis alkaliphilus]|uniref:Uncharacterized protein n=1 Tax=Glycocaulis alkaliphilus TaxID=1434191 RepID=A0A3T0ED36_9PROT|nr:hypothetical protein [Glycocaulis alkaliphilus]AZU05207.1 hypothetical protein X907_2696 [Glycocaulis alkaliphilus]GGB64412.1 hypothetical protein GCM10007417_00110 [Glycocaulis alkaliphilus]